MLRLKREIPQNLEFFKNFAEFIVLKYKKWILFEIFCRISCEKKRQQTFAKFSIKNLTRVLKEMRDKISNRIHFCYDLRLKREIPQNLEFL